MKNKFTTGLIINKTSHPSSQLCTDQSAIRNNCVALSLRTVASSPGMMSFQGDRYFSSLERMGIGILITLSMLLGILTNAVQAQQNLPLQVNANSQIKGDYLKNRIVFKFREGQLPVLTIKNKRVTFNIPAVDNLNAKYNCVIAKRINEFKGEPESLTYYLDFAHGVDVASVINEYLATDYFEYVEPDYICEGAYTTPNDTYFGRQYAFYNDGTYSTIAEDGADIKMKQAWDVTKGSSSVIVAVIDGGAKLDHPELNGRLWRNPDVAADILTYPEDSLGWNFISNTNNPTDDYGHGTLVAGIIGAESHNGVGYTGMDWHCKLMILKALDHTNHGSLVALTQAITYAVNHGAHIINISIASSDRTTYLPAAINNAYSHNITCVAAMGNANSADTAFPAGYNHVIAVGATNEKDWRWAGSNRGGHISVVAPGSSIMGLWYLSNTDYNHGNDGTSFAAPMVSGLAALLLAQKPGRSPDLIKAIIDSTADDTVGNPAEDVRGFDHYHGNGRINAWRALCYYTGKITGPANICVGGIDTLRDTSLGGVWTSSETSVATINSTNGAVTGVSAGTAIITYKLANGCMVNKTMSVINSVKPIRGDTTVCIHAIDSLRDSTIGGFWFSSDTFIAKINSAGVVLGVAAGTAVISYQMPTGCLSTLTITVLPIPGPIYTDSTVCVGQLIFLHNDSLGGTWSVSNPLIITNATNIITGVAAGTAIVTYTIDNGCYAIKGLTVNPVPAPITGPIRVCVAATITLADATTAGRWEINDSTLASVNHTTGLVTGLIAGTTTISYVLPTGCYVTYAFTVNPLPARITGPDSVCSGFTITLADSSQIIDMMGFYPGFFWSSNTSVATVNANSGLVTAGTVTSLTNVVIHYKLYATNCDVSKTITVCPMPGAITGPTSVCVNADITLANSVSGGTWISSNIAVATVGTAGVVTGVAAGTLTITYLMAGGCLSTKLITVKPLPVITGSPFVCVSATRILTANPTGGTWASSTSSVASVDGAGTVSGVAVGTTVITYTLPTTCYSTVLVQVTPSPGPITGTLSECARASTTLTNSVTGGAWASSNSNVTVGSSSGVVTGVRTGTSIITYTSNGCISTTIFTVLNSPTTIVGPASICAGTNTTLSDTVAGGTWVSSNTSMATISPSSGILNGINVGSSIITYTLSTGCFITKTISITTLPDISGPNTVCLGRTITLTDSLPGGSWSTSAPTIATINSAGVVTGIAGGLAATITYYMGTGCRATKMVTVNPLGTISGPASVCQGQSINLTYSGSGGTWSSDAISIATVTTGTVTGVSAGTANISYTLPTGCYAISVVRVNPLSPITGPSSVCAGQTISLGNTIIGGTWTSSSSIIASVSGSGIVTGNFGGYSATISYALSTGCTATYPITVNALGAISGPGSVCRSQTITLTYTGGSGTWSSSSPSIASVSAGTVTGNAAGAAIISFTTTAGCSATYTVTVNAYDSITGPSVVCVGQTISLSDAATGGTWSTASGSVATVSSSGIVTGMSAGTTIISYTMPGGCRATKTVLVTSSTISGPSSVCRLQTITLSNATPGGTWSSSSTSTATVNVSSGLVTGIAAGTVIITYTTSGCAANTTITVTAFDTISGPSSVCTGRTITLTDAVTSGTWASSSVSIATVGASTGIVSGIAGGTSGLNATITYTLGVCKATKLITVVPMGAVSIPGPGEALFCVGGTITATTTSTGGTWSSSNTSIATISSSGVLTGVAAGAVTITYTTSSGCIATGTAVVNPLAPISGPTSVMVGSTVTLTDPVPGGAWTCHSSVVTVGPTTGVVTGMYSGYGTATILYVLSTGCTASLIMSVLPHPAPPAHSSLSTGSLDGIQIHSGIGYDKTGIIAAPNPNNGAFIVHGLINEASYVTIAIEVLDMAGRVVYSGSSNAVNGIVNERVILSSTLSNGVYLIKVRNSDETYTAHFVIAR